MALEIVVQAGLGLVEFVEVDIGFHSEERIRFFASMSAEVTFCVLRPSGRRSQRHAGTEYGPTCNETGGKKKGLPASTLGDALFIPIDFRLSLAPQHNPHRICGRRLLRAEPSKRHYATIARRFWLRVEAAYSGSVSDCTGSNAVSFLKVSGNVS
jgi:hypothetical protein